MEFLSHLPAVFSPWHLVVAAAGTFVGLLVGLLPGLSPTLAVALLIPLTFHMDAASSLILLGAVYTGAVAGGAVSAVLVNIPGAPANIATVLDGYPLAQQGRATEALHYSFLSSFVGGVIGVLVLAFSTPLLAEISLAFGPAQLFWIALLGITAMGSLSGESVLKGLFAGVFGMWLATIGYDPVLGEERYVISSHLTGGINPIAALIGLFAVPQVLSMLQDGGRSQAYSVPLERWRLSNSIRLLLGRWRALAIGSAVGVVVGLIPGIGGQVSGLLAYDQARKTSSQGGNFGHGEPEGVIAAESANNAMVGPSLVPLLTLSVPGSPTAAVLLGGLLIHGIFPGPTLFSEHAQTTWTFIDSLLVSQGFMLVFGLLISRSSRLVMRVPGYYLAAGITVLAVFGTYSVQNSDSDVLVMITLGIGMYFASKLGFSSAPVVLGLILGPIAESNFIQGKIIAETQQGLVSYFLVGDLNVVLIALCFASVGFGLFGRSKRERN